jgi:probable ribonuclease FAU-1
MKGEAMRMNIKVRGIYATALSKLFMDQGHELAEPSSRIRLLFGLAETEARHEVLVQDRETLQGIYVSGEAEKVSPVVTFLLQQLFDATLLSLMPMEEPEGGVTAVIEFPGSAKTILDDIRQSMLPTLKCHHRFRVVASKPLEKAESALKGQRNGMDPISNRLFREVILVPLEKSGVARVEHIRPSGGPMRPREGTITEVQGQGFTFKRSFAKGRYDGLDVPIRPGDYGLTEIQEGAWYVRHVYFRRDGSLIGEYYNINTPVELYPYGARYLDLEVDVVRRAGEKPYLLDREKLALLAHQGSISSQLEEKAMGVAEQILNTLLV